MAVRSLRDRIEWTARKSLIAAFFRGQCFPCGKVEKDAA